MLLPSGDLTGVKTLKTPLKKAGQIQNDDSMG